MIHPPPVTKSGQEAGGGGNGCGQPMSAWADDITTSATPGTTTWSALTVIAPGGPVGWSVSTPGTDASSSDASSEPPSGGSGPASANVIGLSPASAACTTVARPLYVMAGADVVENAGPGAAGFRASEHAPTNSAAARAATGRDWESFIVHLRVEVRGASNPKTRAPEPHRTR